MTKPRLWRAFVGVPKEAPQRKPVILLQTDDAQSFRLNSHRARRIADQLHDAADQLDISQTGEAMTHSIIEPVGQGFLSALAAERTARKRAEHELKELRAKYRAKCDEAELWQYRSRRNLEELHTIRIANATKEATQNEH